MEGYLRVLERWDVLLILKGVQYSASFLQNERILSRLAGIVTQRRRSFFTGYSRHTVGERLESLEEYSYQLSSFFQLFEYKEQFQDLRDNWKQLNTTNQKYLVLDNVENLEKFVKEKNRKIVYITKILIILFEILENAMDSFYLLTKILLLLKNMKLIKLSTERLENLSEKFGRYSDIMWSVSLFTALCYSFFKLTIKKKILNTLISQPANNTRTKKKLQSQIAIMKVNIFLYFCDLLTAGTSALSNEENEDKTLLFSGFSAFAAIFEYFYFK